MEKNTFVFELLDYRNNFVYTYNMYPIFAMVKK